MAENFLKELESKGVIPANQSPYIELVESNPVLYDGLSLHDFYSLSPHSFYFSRGSTNHLNIQYKGEPIDTLEKFGTIYSGARRGLAKILEDKKYEGGLKPLELFLVCEYFSLQRKGQYSKDLTISDRIAAFYPHVNLLWECGLAEYANHVEGEDKEKVLGNSSKFHLRSTGLREVVLANETNPIPMLNSLQFVHTEKKNGSFREDDEIFNKIGIPQTYLDYLRENYGANYGANVIMENTMIWHGNGALFNTVCDLAEEFRSYTDRFNDFLKQFSKFQE